MSQPYVYSLFPDKRVLFAAAWEGCCDEIERTLPWTLAPVVIAPLTAPPADRFGIRPFMVLGTFLQAAALVWFALTVGEDTPYPLLVPGLLAAGTVLLATVLAALTPDVPATDR